MDRMHALALVHYLQRAVPIVPTTGAEWTQLSGALVLIENVAQGLITLESSPVAGPAIEGTAADPPPPITGRG